MPKGSDVEFGVGWVWDPASGCNSVHSTAHSFTNVVFVQGAGQQVRGMHATVGVHEGGGALGCGVQQQEHSRERFLSALSCTNLTAVCLFLPKAREEGLADMHGGEASRVRDVPLCLVPVPERPAGCTDTHPGQQGLLEAVGSSRGCQVQLSLRGLIAYSLQAVG